MEAAGAVEGFFGAVGGQAAGQDVALVRFGFRLADLAQGGLFGVGEAFGVDAEEDGDAVAGPFGDLGGGDAGVEPGGQAGVAQVVGAFGQWGGGFGGGERGLAGLVPGAGADGVGEQVAAVGRGTGGRRERCRIRRGGCAAAGRAPGRSAPGGPLRRRGV